MRLLRIRLRDFRGVHDRDVALGEAGITVLQGENEVGKTSTVTALDLLLDVPDSSKRTEVRTAAPVGVDAGPQVEAEIVTGEYHLVYRKRWLRRPLTELDVLSPRREQLTGSAAHARVNAILDETIDRDLWRALRIEQHTPVGQVELGGYAALTRALDRAAAGGTGATGDAGEAGQATADGLVERAEEELRRYRTPTGRPARELADAETRLADAEQEHERCTAAVAAVEQDVAERDRLDAELDRLTAHRGEHQARVAELEDRWAALASRQGEVEHARDRALAARERADAARSRSAARVALVARVDEAEAAAVRAATRATEHADAHAAARDDRTARRAEHDEAREAAVAARAHARRALDRLDGARDRAELADLDDRLARVDAAAAELGDAEHEATDAVGEADLGRLEELALAVVRADAARDAGAASLELRVPDDATALEVDLDGATTALAPGEVRRVPVHDAATVTLPGVLEVRVRPGREGGGLADAARAASDELHAACAALGVADVAAARATRRRADQARRRLDEHAATLARELAGRSVADVRAERDAVAARLDARPDPGPAPADLLGAGATADVAVLRTRAEGARFAAEQADGRAADAEHRRDEADEAARTADTEAALLAERAAEAGHARDRAATELADARRDEAAGDDDALAAEAQALLARAREAENAHQSLAAALAADDPDSVEAMVTSARGVDDRFAAETADVERRRNETTGRLQSAGHQGWHDQLGDAVGELDAARRARDAVLRRARAAARLHETLVRHRDAVRRAYVAPFRDRVERLARIVFGPGVSLEVDPALRITHRTLDGVTVAFDDLSSGAKEQLGLCARLACAALVDPAEGVPVVIDDALGHSDPERLARLGAVFTAATAGGTGQVLVLTCTPERYRAVGAATVVTLAPSRPDPTERLGAPGPRPAPAARASDADPGLFRAG